MTNDGARSLTALEAMFRRDRLLVGVALVAACLLCWAWIVPLARDMYGPMSGAAASTGGGRWDFRHGALLFAMWAVMMAGMMLPAVAPTVLLYARVVRSAGGTRVHTRTGVFVGGYLLVWTAFSLGASLLQRDPASSPPLHRGGHARAGRRRHGRRR